MYKKLFIKYYYVMSNNIEQIKSKVSDAKNQIEKSKQLSVEDKMAKAKELEVTISQIKTDLDSLKVDASAEDLAKIQAVESEYESLNTQFQTEFKQALSDLEKEVKDTNTVPFAD
jgi:F0F1-type ATP synthase membrane subunit b/b'